MPPLPLNGTARTSAADCTPGTARTFSIVPLKKRAMSSGFAYFVCGSRNCSVNTFDASKPSGACWTASRLWMSSAESATSATDSAISTTMNASRVRRPAPEARRKPACSVRAEIRARRPQRRRQAAEQRHGKRHRAVEQEHDRIERQIGRDRHR